MWDLDLECDVYFSTNDTAFDKYPNNWNNSTNKIFLLSDLIIDSFA